MYEMIDLQKYLVGERKKIEAMEKPLAFLEGIKIPLRVKVFDDKVNFYSSDYSLATDFNFNNRSKLLSSFCGYNDGGYQTELIEKYPQFYFMLEKFQVLIQHKGFETDKRIVITSRNYTQGHGVYSDKTGSVENYLYLEDTLSFFEKKGVNKKLLKTLQERIDDWLGV